MAKYSQRRVGKPRDVVGEGESQLIDMPYVGRVVAQMPSIRHDGITRDPNQHFRVRDDAEGERFANNPRKWKKR